ncbi:glycosyltransferase family 2 protein [Martelella mediterranea]|uniref:Putative glycosyltransferase EpsJ n=1 Tax=Martelella mediterranea DSM 17316 TaxID=1122214 RepID=A0A1U9Z025_9HYPH|nr:glycosyltransferase family 2 protein [Martelella mediterranea]AQZ51039.1 putative glycosyltransferase EpsJ [Martelella mediterranea DSM 17316]
MEAVSVIVATYNDEFYIAECLESVVAAGAAEIIVINDASTDGTQVVLERLDIPQMRVITLPENAGPSAARNIGLAAATHRYCAVIDADDIIPPQRLQVMTEIARQVDACVVVDELMAFNSQTREIMWSKLSRIPLTGPSHELRTEDMIRHDLGFLKPMLDLEKLRRIGVTYPENIRRGEDFIFLLEILQRGEKIFATSKTHYLLRRRIQQRLTSNRPRLYAELLGNEIRFHARHSWNLPQHLQFLRRHVRNALALGKNSVTSFFKARFG